MAQLKRIPTQVIYHEFCKIHPLLPLNNFDKIMHKIPSFMKEITVVITEHYFKIGQESTTNLPI
jgi:hypothetical protein